MKTPLIKMENIHKWFGNVKALEDVDFIVNEEEIVGLVGDNGAGKSTLAKILAGIYSPNKGKIFIKGEKVKLNSSRDAIKRGIETLYQETAVINNLNIMRNLFLGREITNSFGLLKKQQMAKETEKALNMINIGYMPPHIFVNNLSGGQRQGVSIARALYFKMRILILDEPTNNISVKESSKILDTVVKVKAEGISSIFITHKIYDVYKICDRIVVLRHGKVLANFMKEDTSIDEITKLLSE